SAIKSGLPMPFTSISAGWIFTLMGLLDDGRPLNQGKSQQKNPCGPFRMACPASASTLSWLSGHGCFTVLQEVLTRQPNMLPG
ncbi:hypothetical protein, partial [Thiolapillus sp.]|uniref:hypothetical protein n=1 Tax=Thiolapillus sp. TaxID=2017437 RepID=UPI003AF9D130